MNKRIIELERQARQLAQEAVDQKKYNTYSEYQQSLSDQSYAKFAELIVRECAELYNHDSVLAPVGQSAWGEAYQDGWIEGTKVYRETLLEHFGVEE